MFNIERVIFSKNKDLNRTSNFNFKKTPKMS